MSRSLLAITLATLTAVATLPAAAADRRVELVNASAAIITEFHASNTGRSSYEEDILGSQVVAPGNSIVVNIDDGSGACAFDFLTVMQTGQRIEQRNVNVCEISRYTIR